MTGFDYWCLPQIKWLQFTPLLFNLKRKLDSCAVSMKLSIWNEQVLSILVGSLEELELLILKIHYTSELSEILVENENSCP